jgi:signal transduction histidine kinase
MSHEIRTPINAVLGFAHICQTLSLPERAGDYVGKIRGVRFNSVVPAAKPVLMRVFNEKWVSTI